MRTCEHLFRLVSDSDAMQCTRCKVVITGKVFAALAKRLGYTRDHAVPRVLPT